MRWLVKSKTITSYLKKKCILDRVYDKRFVYVSTPAGNIIQDFSQVPHSLVNPGVVQPP